MKKNIAIIATIATMIFSGCGDDRSHPNSIDKDGNQIVYKNPTALIDLNATDHVYSEVTKAYTVGTGTRTFLASPFIFDGKNSQDNDEDNKSIKSYKWDIKFTHIPSCVDINKTSTKAIFKFVNTDTNNTCQDTAITPGEINATLTVTDNEGNTSVAIKNIKTN